MSQPKLIQETDNKKKKRYVNLHMNRLMKKARKAFDEGHEDAEVSMARPAEWEGDTFEAIIGEWCDAIQEVIGGGDAEYLDICVNYTLPEEESVPYYITLSACWRHTANPFCEDTLALD
jgi:hypothetical protein